ncbi:MAG TPA: PstS family phosphate ABC transporter substrate-binding protein [Acidimicrobiia bacterium]|nr:PstS family phosphate ABC transporter substrate-binding protein [Acidimicrobiia bacterium]
MKRIIALGVLAGVVLAACGGNGSTITNGSGEISGTIVIDGSSTVTPLITVAAEDFQAVSDGVQVTVATSGTGGGFEKFCVGETDVSMASRPISEEESATCAENGIEPVEFIVANDALSVIVNPDNDWASCLTVEQLNTMWAPESEGIITNWNQVDPSFPDQELALFGAGSDSGTFDYFTDEINGEEGAIRTDYNPSEDDNVTIVGVEGDVGAVGFLGLSYVLENEGRIAAVEVDGGGGCVAPSADTVIDGSYTPLGRPLFVYFKAESLQRPEVGAFAQYYADNQETITETALFIPLSEEQAASQQAALDSIVGA